MNQNFWRGLLCSTLLLSGTVFAETVTEATAYNGEEKFIMGTCSHFELWRGSLTHNLDLIEQAGCNSVRDEVAQWSVEKEKGVLKLNDRERQFIAEIRARKMNPLPILYYPSKDMYNWEDPIETPAAYGRYVEYVVSELKSQKLRWYQLWNEWGGSPEQYIRLLDAGAAAVRKADPSAKVVSNSFNKGLNYLERCMELGLLQKCDILSVHNYNMGEGNGNNTPEFFYEWLLKLRELCKKYNNGVDKPLFITEFGYPTHSANTGGCSPAEEAKKLVRTYLLMRTLPFVKGLWWYDFEDDGLRWYEQEDNFGIVRPGLTPKPAWAAMKDIAPLITRGVLEKRIDVGNPDVWILQFRLDDETVYAMWSGSNNTYAKVIMKNRGEYGTFTCRIPGQLAQVRSWGMRDDSRRDVTAVHADRVNFILTDEAILVQGKINADFSLEKNIVFLPYWLKPFVAGQKEIVATACGTPEKIVTISGKECFSAPYTKRKWVSDDDISATFSVAYDASNLYLTINVKDDVFSNGKTSIEEAWDGDSIQLGIRAAVKPEKVLADRTEIDVALLPNGVDSMLRASQIGLPFGTKLTTPPQITREGVTTSYRLVLPAVLLGVEKFSAGDVFDLSIVINDRDGLDAPRGFLEWGRGVASAFKDPAYYNRVICE